MHEMLLVNVKKVLLKEDFMVLLSRFIKFKLCVVLYTETYIKKVPVLFGSQMHMIWHEATCTDCLYKRGG